VKKIAILMFISTLIFVFAPHKKAYAAQSKVKIMFMDTLYGAAVGALIGGIVILNDDDNWEKKLTLGVTLGAIGGLAFGFVEGAGMLSKADDPVRIPSRPLLAFRKTQGGTETLVHVDLISVYF